MMNVDCLLSKKFLLLYFSGIRRVIPAHSQNTFLEPVVRNVGCTLVLAPWFMRVAVVIMIFGNFFNLYAILFFFGRYLGKGVRPLHHHMTVTYPPSVTVH